MKIMLAFLGSCFVGCLALRCWVLGGLVLFWFFRLTAIAVALWYNLLSGDH